MMTHIDENNNGKCCQLCKKNIARNESYGCGVFLCELCATTKLQDEVKDIMTNQKGDDYANQM